MISRRSLPPYPPEPAPDGGAVSDAPSDAQSGTQSGTPAGALPPVSSAERDAAVLALTGHVLTLGRLLLLWLTAGLAVLGCAAVALAVRSFEDGGLGLPAGGVALVLAAVFLVPAAAGLGLWLSRGQDVRDRLDAWAYSGLEPVTDRRVRAHGRCVAWLLPSVALCLAGVTTAVRAAGRLETVTLSDSTYALGVSCILLVTGLLGVVQSLGHQRWAGRLLDPVPIRARGGAHR